MYCQCPSKYHKQQSSKKTDKVPIIDIKQKGEFDNRGYTDLETGLCKARFSRDIYAQTAVDPKTGALVIKKGEAWLNTFTPAISYLLKYNHNITSLLLRTTIKSVIAYIADYITKTPLKTHVMFKSI